MICSLALMPPGSSASRRQSEDEEGRRVGQQGCRKAHQAPPWGIEVPEVAQGLGADCSPGSWRAALCPSLPRPR